MGLITWDQANFLWNNNKWNEEKKNKFIKLILKVHGDTITESKKREIKQYKIKAKDIKIAVKEVLGAKMIAENVSI
mgnify:CR=1 FL=1